MPRFHDELRELLRTEGTIYAAIRETNDLTDEITGKLDTELQKFVSSFDVEATGSVT